MSQAPDHVQPTPTRSPLMSNSTSMSAFRRMCAVLKHHDRVHGIIFKGTKANFNKFFKVWRALSIATANRSSAMHYHSHPRSPRLIVPVSLAHIQFLSSAPQSLLPTPLIECSLAAECNSSTHSSTHANIIVALLLPASPLPMLIRHDGSKC